MYGETFTVNGGAKLTILLSEDPSDEEREALASLTDRPDLSAQHRGALVDDVAQLINGVVTEAGVAGVVAAVTVLLRRHRANRADITQEEAVQLARRWFALGGWDIGGELVLRSFERRPGGWELIFEDDDGAGYRAVVEPKGTIVAAEAFVDA